MAEWQPIETAPKNGVQFLGYSEFTTICVVAFWDTDASCIRVCWDDTRINCLTAWMPLPEPPAAPAQSKGESE